MKTVEGMIQKTLKFVLGEARFKVLGASRTDAMVSAGNAAFELFIEDTPLGDLQEFLEVFNRNLPPDIQAIDIREVDANFNIIQDVTRKEYLYLFASDKKKYPFSAPMMACFSENLRVDVMMEAARIFEGTHSFHNYCTKPSKKTVLQRHIECCRVEGNTNFTASFFPVNSYCLRVRGAGFLRNQVRLMMGGLVQVGRGVLSPADIQESLKPGVHMPMEYIAPGSGLILNNIEFKGVS